MNCPKCSNNLHRIMATLNREQAEGEFSGKKIQVSVAQCFNCNGTWFESGELKSYLDMGLVIINSPEIDAALLQKHDEMVALCPACNIPMNKLPAPKMDTVTIDKCRQCSGIWLDTTEIDLLEDANHESTYKFFSILSSLF